MEVCQVISRISTLLGTPKIHISPPSRWFSFPEGEILLMEEILHQLRMVVYPIIYKVSYIPGGCLGYLPSTVCWEYPNSPKDLCAMYRQKLIQVLPKEKLSTDIGRINKYDQRIWKRCVGCDLCFLCMRQVDVKIGSGIDLGERYLDGIQVRLEWFGRFLADLAHTWNWPKWTRFFQKHLHPSAVSNALARGFLSILLEGAVASEDLQMLPDVFIDFGEPFLVGCCS